MLLVHTEGQRTLRCTNEVCIVSPFFALVFIFLRLRLSLFGNPTTVNSHRLQKMLFTSPANFISALQHARIFQPALAP